MADNKDPPVEPKVEISDTKSLVANRSPRKTKIAVFIGVLTVVLLLGAVVSAAAYFSLRRGKSTPTRLTEINLEEGETLTYRVDQRLEVREGEVLTGKISALVGIRVLNKTSDEYWFLMKLNVTVDKGDLDMKGFQSEMKDYFLVRVKISPRSHEASQTSEQSEDPFEVYGNPHIDKELIRYVHGLTDQLLPAVTSDLYEDIDGEKKDSASKPKPEVSSLYPAAVKMHRQANTSDQNQVFIKNHFNRSDFVNMSSQLDQSMEYSDFVSINKSNGMVTESRAYLSHQLNFGATIHTKRGFDINSMNTMFSSHVSLVETDIVFFDYAQVQTGNVRLFVKLVIPTRKESFTDGKPKFIPVPPDNTSNSAARPSNQTVPARRYRRSLLQNIWNILKRNFKSAPVVANYQLFKTELFGMNVIGNSKLWLEKKENNPLEVGVNVTVAFGDVAEVALISVKYDGDKISKGDTTPTVKKWSTKFETEYPVGPYLFLGVEFTMSLELQVKVNFPPDENKLTPCLFALEIEPDAKAVAEIKGFASVYFLRAGAYGDGTVVDVSLPLKFSFRVDRKPGEKWGLTLHARMTALELSAGIFYQWRKVTCSSWWSCSFSWGARKTFYEFGKWTALKLEQLLFSKYF